jgi:hypothetical protein
LLFAIPAAGELLFCICRVDFTALFLAALFFLMALFLVLFSFLGFGSGLFTTAGLTLFDIDDALLLFFGRAEGVTVLTFLDCEAGAETALCLRDKSLLFALLLLL